VRWVPETCWMNDCSYEGIVEDHREGKACGNTYRRTKAGKRVRIYRVVSRISPNDNETQGTCTYDPISGPRVTRVKPQRFTVW
jgi:hypothetical protein